MLNFQEKILTDCIRYITENSASNIQIIGNSWSHNEYFFQKIAEKIEKNAKNILVVMEYSKKNIQKLLQKHKNSHYDCVIFFAEMFSLNELERFLQSENITTESIIFSSTTTENNNCIIFSIPSISFREYAENLGTKITMKDVLRGEADIEFLEKIAHDYCESGSFVENITNPDEIFEEFSKKCAIIHEELFDKEKDDFQNFLSVVAMNIQSLFKEDFVAKSMNISRRKVAKYLALLEKYNIITEVKPFCQNPEKELSRHKKYYFSDLAYYRAVMGKNYGVGNSHIALMENFIFLELSRKLHDSHNIFFWKKKSWTELAFVLENKENSLLSPIEVGFSSTKNISQTMKSFYESYENRIEYGMFLNENVISAKQFQKKSFLTIPFYTI